MTTVLVVASDRVLGTHVSNELEKAGHAVMWCRGPQAPDYICRAGRPGRCPLTGDADVAVVDGWLASDEHRVGIPSGHLIGYYRGFGIPVVALVGPDGWKTRKDDGIVLVPREHARERVAAAVASLISERVGA